MKQRAFPWIQGLPEPHGAPRRLVAQCTGYGMAARVALAAKPGGPWTDAWLASRLKVSRGYLSRVLNEQQPMPRWMLRPITYATGSRLVQQYHELFGTSECEVSRLADMLREAA
jgi:AraC-like DNA-binding protein